jgi:hypothetical protein
LVPFLLRKRFFITISYPIGKEDFIEVLSLLQLVKVLYGSYITKKKKRWNDINFFVFFSIIKLIRNSVCAKAHYKFICKQCSDKLFNFDFFFFTFYVLKVLFLLSKYLGIISFQALLHLEMFRRTVEESSPVDTFHFLRKNFATRLISRAAEKKNIQ